MKIYNTIAATKLLATTVAGQKILAHASVVGTIESAIDDGFDGILGADAAKLAASLPSFYEEVPDSPEETARLAGIAARKAEIAARRTEITAAIVAAIQTGRCLVSDTGTNSVSETTIFGAGMVAVAVLPHYDARLGGMGYREIKTPADAKNFIDSAAVNSGGIQYLSADA